jgi:hypothetical protein
MRPKQGVFHNLPGWNVGAIEPGSVHPEAMNAWRRFREDVAAFSRAIVLLALWVRAQ